MEQTRRQKIISLLQAQPARISDLARILAEQTRVIEDDIRHIEKNPAYRLTIEPPYCESCDYVFRKREKHSRPSRCPHCKSEQIAEEMIHLAAR